jgi:hypothetical protein
MFTRRRVLSLIPTELACLQGEENCLIQSRLVWYQQNLHVYKEKRIVSDTNRAYMFTRRRELSLIPTELTGLQGEENCL